MAKREPVAIIGVSSIYPGSFNAPGFWRDILAGRDMIEDIPPTHWLIDDYYDPNPLAQDKVYAKRGAFVSPIAFDLIEFGIPPSSLPAIDAMQLMGLLAARDLLRDAANGREHHVPLDRIAVYIGVAGVSAASMLAASRMQKPHWVKGMREAGIPESVVQKACEKIAENYTPLQENTFPGLLSNVVSGRIANRFNLGGGNYTVDAACASSLAALSAALNDLYLGNSDMSLFGGVDMQNNHESFACFSKTPALSPTQDIRPFSEDSDGTMLGEGAGLFALRRLSDAERDGDKIYAVIRGLGYSSDGRAKSVYAPRPQGQSMCIRRAYEAAGYDPQTVELIEAHGTATPAGDVSEFESMRMVFGDQRIGGEPTIALGSIKSQIGHTKGAAGAAGLFKVTMALHNKVLPPTIKVTKPNPKLKLDESPFYLNTETRPWVASGRNPRRASVSSFGFGGTNFHVTVEEYLGSGNRPERWAFTPTELVLLSAGNRQELAAACTKLANAEQTFDDAWRRLARESQRSFQPERNARLAIVVGNSTELTSKLKDAATDLEKAGPVNRPGLFFAEGQRLAASPVAFVFAGQGSQAVGMGRHLAMTFPFAQQIWDAAEPVLADQGLSLRTLVFPPPVFDDEWRAEQLKKLTATENLQPALAVQGMMHLGLMRALGVSPTVAIGHSFGELLALHAAGVMDERSLLLASRKRGELMSATETAPGAMTAVTHPASELQKLVEEWQTGVVLANYNSPTQTVLSGAVEAIEETEKRLSMAKIKFRRLPVSAAFHSPLIAAAVSPFQEFLQSVELKAPLFDVLSNADVAAYPADAAAIPGRLANQLAQPVRFAEQVEEIYRRGVRLFVELGMGNTLSSLVDQILEGREHIAIPLERKGVHGLTSMWEAVGRLSVAGLKLNLDEIRAAFAPVKEPEKPRSAASTVYISGAMYGKPYPPKGGSAVLPKPNPEPVREDTVPGAAVSALNSTPPIPVAPVISYPPSPLVSPSSLAHAPGGNMAQRPPDSKPLKVPSNGASANSSPQSLYMWNEIHRQIELAQQTTQSAILETHSLTLQSLERLALGNGNGFHKDRPYQERPLANNSWAPENPVATMPSAAQPIPAAPPRFVPPTFAQPAVAPQGQVLMPQPTNSMAPPPVPTWNGIAAPAPPVASPVPVATIEVQQPSSLGGAELTKELLQVVSEKTGYPIEVLDLDVELEAGLGIDSIKRVEIFSAMQQLHPNLPEVTAEHMGSLRTLRQITDFLCSSNSPVAAEAGKLEATESSPVSVPPPAAPADSASAPLGPDGESIKKLLLAVVSEKTGYPIEVLDEDVELEAGLGIDSIKRVEIFSAVQQQLPGLPQVTAEHMGTLRTLRQIVDFLANKPEPDQSAAEASEASTSQPVSEATAPAVHRLDVHEVVAPLAGVPMPGLMGCLRLAVKDDGPEGIAATLVEELSRMGLPAYLATTPVSDGSALILTAGFGANTSGSEGAAKSSTEMHLEALKWLQALQAGSSAPPVLVVVENCGGDFNLSGRVAQGAWAGGVGAMARTAAIEWEKSSVKIVDVERAGRETSEAAAAVVQELMMGGNLKEVGLHADGRRTTLQTIEVASVADDYPCISEDSVLVISGGGRGVTSACLIELARAHQPKMVLLGRTRLIDLSVEYPGLSETAAESEIKRYLIEQAKASGAALELAVIAQQSAEIAAVREIQQTLASLQLAGSEAMYLSANVSDAASVSASLETARSQWGPITGIVHAAGVIADKLIQDKTEDQFRRVFTTKVAGMEALLSATAQDPIRLIVCFSSVAARYGNTGQCDYAAANEVLNQLTATEARKRGPECLAKALAWGPWEGGMVTPGLAAQFKARGIGMIPLEGGARQFVQELSGKGGSVQVIIGHGEDFARLSGPQVNPLHESSSAEFLVNSRSFPMLAGHVIRNEEPTLPMVFVLEFFARVAEMMAPQMEMAGCSDLRMLRGVIVKDYKSAGIVLRVNLKHSEGNSLFCELRSLNGDLHYTGRIELRPRTAANIAVPAIAAPEPVELPENVRAQYNPKGNFHGAEFQVLRSIEKVEDTEAVTTLVGVVEMGWQSGPWVTDAAALDGALQTVCMWYHMMRGAQLLPTHLGEYVQHASQLVEGLIHCQVSCRHAGSYNTISNLQLTGPQGEIIAELRDLEMHALPNAE